MLVKGKEKPTYQLSSNIQIRLSYQRFGYASNARVILTSKLVNRIDLREIGTVDKPHSFDSKSFDSNAEAINKAIEHNLREMEELCEVCIESKHRRIVKL